MAAPVLMPKQGQSVESCIITEWHKNKGEEVKKGDLLFSYETDKASFEEEAQEDGILLDIFYDSGDEVPVLVNVAVIGKEGESVDEFRSGDAPDEEHKSEEKNEETEAETRPAQNMPVQQEEFVEGKIKISPRAKRLANKMRISYQSARGTGPRGRIIERDIEALAKEAPAMTAAAKQKADDENLQAAETGSGLGGRVTTEELTSTNVVYGVDFEDKPLSNIRKIIAKGMFTSLQNSAQLTHHMSADVRKMQEARKKVKAAMEQGSEDNITLNDMVCFVVIKTLKKFKDANCHFLDNKMRIFNKVHLGLAVDTPRGLMVPAIKNADDLSIQGLSKQLKAVANQCKQGNIDPELLASTAATFTVSNLGAYGVEMFTPVLNIPQIGILGVNTITPRPKDLGGGVYGFVPHIGLSLTYDHRALDGGPATLFLKEIKDGIENFNEI